MARRRPEPLAGRAVVVTGAGSGIGRALARRLSRAGCPVAVADVDKAALAETVTTLRDAAPREPVLETVLDVRDAAAVADLAREVRDWAPRPLGAVFNNAGVTVTAGVLGAVPEDDDWVLDVNLHGVINGVRAFLPILVEQDAGAIVNTSSVFGLVGMPFQSAYCASKFAVRGFTDALRQELRGTGVRAVTVHPGGVDTNIVRNARYRSDPGGTGRSHDEFAREFAGMTRTSPDRAARIIHQGVDRGRARILVGPDAYLFDALARVTPTHYFGVLERLAAGRRGRR